MECGLGEQNPIGVSELKNQNVTQVNQGASNYLEVSLAFGVQTRVWELLTWTCRRSFGSRNTTTPLAAPCHPHFFFTFFYLHSFNLLYDRYLCLPPSLAQEETPTHQLR